MPRKRPAYRLRHALARVALEAKLAWRRRGGPRMRPSLFIVGAQKAGTTSLHGHLARHPQVLPPLVKEVHYFDVAAHRGDGWYAGHFPTLEEARAREAGIGAPVMTFDTTPYYMFHPEVARRIRAYAPAAKIIAVLRDPAARAWSHYWHEWSRGFEGLSPREAFDAENGRIPAPHETIADARAHQHYSYVARSEYDRQIARWQSLFPADQLLWLKSEALFDDPETVLTQVTDFLGIAPFDRFPDRALNTGDYDRPPQDIAAWLETRLEPTVNTLATMPGVGITWR